MAALRRTVALGTTWLAGPIAVASVCLLLVLTLLSIEFAAPGSLTLGSVMMIPVVLAARRSLRVMLTVLVGVEASRAVRVLSGGMSPQLALVEMGSYLLVIALLRLTSQGGVPQSPQMADRRGQEPPPARLGDALLSSRERQVVDMTIDGLTARQIGERLFIGRRTVETHLESAYAKLQIDSKRELIAQAFDARREAAVTTLGALSRPDDRLSKG